MDHRPAIVGTGIVAFCLAFATSCASATGNPSSQGPGAAPGAGTSAAAATATTAQPTCTPAQLGVKAVTSGSGAGHSDLMIAVTNLSSTMCGLSGYPSVVGTLQSGATVRGVETTSGYLGAANPDLAPGPVQLAPGAAAWIALNFDDNPVNGAATCPMFASFSITPPGVDRAFTVSAIEYGSVYAPDCDGVEVPPVLSAANAVIPSSSS
jgi:Protein of unknown function (DUF4232)